MSVLDWAHGSGDKYNLKFSGLRIPIRILSLTCAFFLLLLQVYLFVFGASVTESTAAWLSIFSAVFFVLLVGTIDLSTKNWLLWFAVFYFLLYQFGPMVGMVLLGQDRSYLDYDTTFGNGANEVSRVTSFFLSGIAASFLSIISFLFPPKSIVFPSNDRYLEKVSFLLWAVSTPFVLVHYAWLYSNFSESYATSYSAEAKDLVSIVPLSWVFINIFNIGFYLWFASVPSERNFRAGFYVFLFASFASSLYGGRIHFIVPFAFILWYRSVVYNRKLSSASLYISGIFAFAFVLIIENFRNQVGIDIDIIVNFLISSLSKAQYTLSIYIDQKDIIDKFGSHYWAAPLLFPYDYLIHGGAIVGQGESSAGIRGDLGHVMPSMLNYGAYISGAGTGSSLVAESYQYGLIGIFPLLLMFYLFYRKIFHSTSSRVILMIAPIVFMHFIFSPRDSLFINSWGLIKPIIAFYVIHYSIYLWRKLYSKQHF